MRFKKVRNVKTPHRGTPLSVGLDMFMPDGEDPIILRPGDSALIPSGIIFDIPKGYWLKAANKSGRAISGLMVGADTIDEDYQGETHLHVVNVSAFETITLKPGEKILQIIMIKAEYPELIEVPTEENLFDTVSARENGGFGSTGLN